MKTESELNNDILKITMIIRDNYPEISKFLAEMPITIPEESHPKINIQILQDYYDSLQSLIIEYDAKHKKIC
ncbi:hypothetical protein [Flavobacterium sp.]|uniref:hypothetical protein n=1 Tax=Flavobacterium sp. TaxID=239 RepID=UPI00286C9136|nr:hypothetical protein [Flavobacterium sp.]